MNDILFEGRIEKRLFLRLQRALLPAGWRWAPLIVLGILIVASMPARAYQVFLDRPLYYVSHIIPGLGLLLASIAVPIWSVEKAWQQNRATKGVVSGRVSEDGIEWHSDELSLRLPWQDISAYRIVRGVPIVFSEKGWFPFAPCLFSSAEDHRSAVAVIAAHAPGT